MTGGRITEDWQAAVVLAEVSAARGLLSRIDTFLYPGVVMAADRAQRLREDFPEFVATIEPILKKKKQEGEAMLDNWRKRKASA